MAMGEPGRGESVDEVVGGHGGRSVRRQVVIATAGVLGAVAVIGGAYLLYARATQLDVPDPKTAPAGGIARFLGHVNGLARLSIEERQAFVTKLLTTETDASRREAMRRALAQMTSQEKETCREALWDVGFAVFFREVDAFRATPPEKRGAFIDRRIAEYWRTRDELAGKLKGSGRRQALLDGSWLEGMPRRGDEIVKMILARTKPKDRARMMPYVDAIGARLAELKRDPSEMARVRSRYAPVESGQAVEEK